MLDALPNSMLKSYNECGIVNLDSYGGHGTHWVAYIKIVNTVYYFDSFGDLPPPRELSRYFGYKRVLYNFRRYQDFNTYLCGHFCLMFLYKNTHHM